MKLLITPEWLRRHTAGDEPDLPCEVGPSIIGREAWLAISAANPGTPYDPPSPRPAKGEEGE